MHAAAAVVSNVTIIPCLQQTKCTWDGGRVRKWVTMDASLRQVESVVTEAVGYQRHGACPED